MKPTTGYFDGNKLDVLNAPLLQGHFLAGSEDEMQQSSVSTTFQTTLACSFCDFNTLNQSEFKEHLAVHKEMIPEKCPFCDYSNIYKVCMEKHLLQHSDNKKLFSCIYCDFKTARKRRINDHMNAKHKNENSERPKKTYNCEQCSYVAKHISNFSKHLLVHSDEKKFPCSYCKYRASTKSRIKAHIMAKHSQLRPFACDLCDYRSAQRGNLKIHIRTAHTEEPPALVCQYCSYKTHKKPHLDAHILTHTKEKNYFCPHCDYKASRKFCLTRHLLTHSNEKRLRCNHCNYTALRKIALNKHMQKHIIKPPLDAETLQTSADRVNHYN